MNYKRKNHHGAARRSDTSGYSNPLSYEKKLYTESRHIGVRNNKYCKRLKGKHDFSELVEEKIWRYVFKKAKCTGCGKCKYIGSEHIADDGEVETRVVATHLQV